MDVFLSDTIAQHQATGILVIYILSTTIFHISDHILYFMTQTMLQSEYSLLSAQKQGTRFSWSAWRVDSRGRAPQLSRVSPDTIPYRTILDHRTPPSARHCQLILTSFRPLRAYASATLVIDFQVFHTLYKSNQPAGSVCHTKLSFGSGQRACWRSQTFLHWIWKLGLNLSSRQYPQAPAIQLAFCKNSIIHCPKLYTCWPTRDAASTFVKQGVSLGTFSQAL